MYVSKKEFTNNDCFHFIETLYPTDNDKEVIYALCGKEFMKDRSIIHRNQPYKVNNILAHPCQKCMDSLQRFWHQIMKERIIKNV